MAPRLPKNGSTGTSDVTQQHNAKHRAEVIESSFQRLYAIDAEIADIIESSDIPSLREEKSAIKKRLRVDFQMPSPLVQARYQGYRLERKAEDSHDDVTLDAIREMYKILPVGGSVNMIDALEGKAPEPEPEDQGGKKGGKKASRKAVPRSEPLPKTEAKPDNVTAIAVDKTSEAYKEGFDAGKMGAQNTFCPFVGKAKLEWLEGWKDARRETLAAEKDGSQGAPLH